MSKLSIEGGKQEIDWRDIVAGCNLCDWSNSTSVPANIQPESTLDKALMANLNNQFAKHNARLHNGQAEMTLLGSTL